MRSRPTMPRPSNSWTNGPSGSMKRSRRAFARGADWQSLKGSGEGHTVPGALEWGPQARDQPCGLGARPVACPAADWETIDDGRTANPVLGHDLCRRPDGAG